MDRNIIKLYAYEAFISLVFFSPIIVLFWLDNGLSLTKIMLLQSIFSVSLIAFEVPSGYISDRIGKRYALSLAGLFISAALVSYSLSSSFSGFLISEIIWAAGIALFSGSDSAYIYERLKSQKKEKSYKKVMGKALFFSLMAISISSILGGIIAKAGYRLCFIASIPFMLSLIPIALSLEEKKRKEKKEKSHLSEIFYALRYSLAENKKLRAIIIYSALLIGINNSVWVLYQPYLKISSIRIELFGIIFAAFNAIAAISSKYAQKIEKHIGIKKLIIFLPVFFALSAFGMSRLFFMSFSLIAIQQIIRGMAFPLATSYINKHSPKKLKATVLSISNMLMRLSYATTIPFLGAIADISISASFIFISLFSLALLMPVSLIAIKAISKKS